MLRRIAITTILTRPARPAECILEIVCHGMGALSTELRGALVVGKIRIVHTSKVEVGRRARGMMDLTFERIQTVGQLFYIAKRLWSAHVLLLKFPCYA